VSDDDRHLRRTMIRVLGVQVATLILLWMLQQHFGH
jgi:hypothetical protein